jgi:hypothetical protein
LAISGFCLQKAERVMLDDIKKSLRAADKLRASMDAAEYKHFAFDLIFVKYASDLSPSARTNWNTMITMAKSTSSIVFITYLNWHC